MESQVNQQCQLNIVDLKSTFDLVAIVSQKVLLGVWVRVSHVRAVRSLLYDQGEVVSKFVVARCDDVGIWSASC